MIAQKPGVGGRSLSFSRWTMKSALAFLAAALVLGGVSADEPGVVGIVLGNSDFRVVERAAMASPAARAGVQAGDRIVAIDGYATSQLQNADELASRAEGAIGTQLELLLQRSGAAQPIRFRMQRVALSTIDWSYSRCEMIYSK
jgi:C-terminal processing protease CtpA/Prc